MKFCNNCGNKLQNNEKFCTECGVKVGTVIENNKEKKSYGNMFNNIFSYNGINVDLNHLSNKHGRNKIHAIKELRSITGISLKEAKGVIDDFYIVEKTDVTPIKIDNNNKGCLNIFLWIIFLPVMLILKIIKTEKYSRNTKILLIIASIVISLPHIVSYFSILITTPQLVLVTAIIYFIYRYKKKREAEDLEARRIKEKRYQLELERKNKIVDKTLDIIFNNKEMSNRLKEFILQHTKKYDNDQIDFSEYLKKINMFLI